MILAEGDGPLRLWRWVITGNPCIGKTLFSGNVLWRLVTAERRVDVAWEPAVGEAPLCATCCAATACRLVLRSVQF
jgi:hypothetical protein